MAVQLQLRSGTTTQHSTFTGAVGEVTVDTTKDVLVVHDGITAGGFPNAARANTDGTISLIKKDGTSAGEVNSVGLFNNTLTSTNTNQALTAAQGKVLKDLTDTKLTETNALGGTGQTWTDLTSSRTLGTTYTNSTGSPIFVSVSVNMAAGASMTGVVDGVTVCRGYAQNSPSEAWAGMIIPNGGSYFVTSTSLSFWMELR